MEIDHWWFQTCLNMVTATLVIPEYICSPVTWKASLALIVSNGYVNKTAVTPAAAPATNFVTCGWDPITFPSTFLYISNAENWVAAYGKILTICAPLPLYRASKFSWPTILRSPENTPAIIWCISMKKLSLQKQQSADWIFPGTYFRVALPCST